MQVRTTRFGTLEIAEEQVLEFSRGLFGFEDVDRFFLFEHPEGSPFRWLQAVDRPDLAFIVMDPSRFTPDYRLDLPVEDRAALGCTPTTATDIWVIVGIPDNPEEMTANLKGPIVINPEQRRGRQVLLENPEYSPRFRIIDAIARRSATPQR